MKRAGDLSAFPLRRTNNAFESFFFPGWLEKLSLASRHQVFLRNL